MREPTEKQKKLLKIIFANIGAKGTTRTMKEMIREAGYKESMASNPQQVLQSEFLRTKVDSFVKQLDDKRRMAITYLTEKKLDESKGRDVAQIIDILTKNHQLLSGGATERVNLYNWGEYGESNNIQPKEVDETITRGDGEMESDSGTSEIGQDLR